MKKFLTWRNLYNLLPLLFIIIIIGYYVIIRYHNNNYLSIFQGMDKYYQSIGDSNKEHIYNFFSILNKNASFIVYLLILDLLMFICVLIDSRINQKVVLTFTYIINITMISFMLLLANCLWLGIPGVVICLMLFLVVYKKIYISLYKIIAALAFILVCIIGIFYYKSLQLPQELKITQNFDSYCKYYSNTTISCWPYYTDIFNKYKTEEFQITFNDQQFLDKINNGQYKIEISFVSNSNRYEIQPNDFSIKDNQLILDLEAINGKVNFNNKYTILFINLEFVDDTGQNVNLNWSDDYTLTLEKK